MSVLFDRIPVQSCASLERNNSTQLLGGPRVNQDWLKSGEWPDFCFEPDLPYNCKAEAAKLAA